MSGDDEEVPDEKLAAIMRRLDRDNDGIIEYEEFRYFLRAKIELQKSWL